MDDAGDTALDQCLGGVVITGDIVQCLVIVGAFVALISSFITLTTNYTYGALKKNPEQVMRQAYHVASQERFKTELLLIDRCDQQCKWLMEGDVRGVYGEFPPYTYNVETETLDPLYALVVKTAVPDAMTTMEKQIGHYKSFIEELKEQLRRAEKAAEVAVKEVAAAQVQEFLEKRDADRRQREAEGWFNCDMCQEYVNRGWMSPEQQQLCHRCRRQYLLAKEEAPYQKIIDDYVEQITVLEQTPPLDLMPKFIHLDPVRHRSELPMDAPDGTMISVMDPQPRFCMPPEMYLRQDGRWMQVAQPASTSTPVGGAGYFPAYWPDL